MLLVAIGAAKNVESCKFIFVIVQYKQYVMYSTRMWADVMTVIHEVSYELLIVIKNTCQMIGHRVTFVTVHSSFICRIDLIIETCLGPNKRTKLIVSLNMNR